MVWGGAPKKSTKNAICATFRRRIVNDSRSLYRVRRASYISIFSPPTIRRKTIRSPPQSNCYLSTNKVQNRKLISRRISCTPAANAHTRTGTEITIAFLTEKDGQMAEKRRKKWRPFCLAHLRRARWGLCMRTFLRKKPNQNKCTWPGVMTGWKIRPRAKRCRYQRYFFPRAF